ncbi:hypothetical protein B0A58_07420 [Flavobacterium branchiophilum NBRC 15030 = ATCC 35035]|uniref:Uncharacterized protein DUF2586 n=1 Tax=Flavobacterium branchiophilum TaxID=55197 RepID=A0A543G118_9FLAO|nr:DUF2586 family protein [Flavobacterium branchiophilum]OXA76393.1 hypothetical protein B0A58_07420 [Flavobacterium branchiophilum NBRC 15030 = ATCC 35035]TQM39783.1 uncharacterized protein DUF2586 [Flavobacterium branchiophilum]GEM55245.1 hypothetical protein FB1_14660 [Flavobacterium branchiophilum NBRC 15030 = ATCC 35035]
MNTISFVRQEGGLNKRLPGEDHVSGLIIYGQADVAKTHLIEVAGLASIGVTPTSHPVLHYHVSEYFRVNPGSKLYLFSIDANDANDAQFVAIKQLQQFAEGKIRQIGIVDLITDFADLSTIAVTIQSRLNELAMANMPLSAVLSIHSITPANLLSLPNLHNLNCERLSVCIGHDGAGRGNYVSGIVGKKIGIVGACLGAISRANIHESIAWVEKQNLVNSTYAKVLTGNNVVARELDVPGFVDGTLLSDFTPAQIQSINDKGYLFAFKHVGYAGTFFNDSFSGAALDSDFSTIENNRTIDKAQRGVYIKLLPKISGPIYINPDTGEISSDTIASLEAIGSIPLEQMERDGELSGFKIFINPNQDVLSTSKLTVTLKIVPVGVLREITVNLGFALSV